MPPSELKKLRSKQRKAKKKAELESAQAAQAQIKREQHQKSKQQSNQDVDPETLQLDELIPEKLERPEDPLEKAIDFLKPLLMLSRHRLETHLLAFEVYSRKKKILLMIQCIRRAKAIDPSHPMLHRCIIRLMQFLPQLPSDLNVHVKAVVDKAVHELIGDKMPQQLNEEFIAENSSSVRHVFEGARIKYELDKNQQEAALALITSIEVDQLSLDVRCNKTLNFYWQ